MAVTYRTGGQENDGSTAAPALSKASFTGLANGETVVVALNHAGVANALAPTAPFALVGELVAPTANESSLHVYVGQSANWAAEAATFTFPISTARGGCILEWVITTGDVVDLAAIVAQFDRETSATPSLAATSTRAGALFVGFTGAKPAAGTFTGGAGGAPAVSWVERLDMSVSATSFLHTQTYQQASAGSATSQPVISASASMAQAVIVLQPPGDTTRPTVFFTDPAGGYRQTPTASVEVHFSELMNAATIGAFTVTKRGSGTPHAGLKVAGISDFDPAKSKWTFTPSTPYAYAADYEVRITTAATDTAGNALASDYVFAFRVERPYSGGSQAALLAGVRLNPQQYAVELVRRSDGVTLAALDPTEFAITRRMHAAGDCRMTLDARSPGAASIDVYKTIIRIWRRRADFRDTVRSIVFAGHVHEVHDEGDEDGNETLTVVARDPWANVERRFQPWNSSWGPAPLHTVLAGFIGDAAISAEDPAGLDATYGHGLAVTNMTALGWPTVTKGFDARKPIPELFRMLQEGDTASQGFYWTVVPHTVADPNIVGVMRVALTPADLASVVTYGGGGRQLEYGPGTQGTVARYSADRIPPVNSVLAVGKEGLSWLINSESSGDVYGLWQTEVSYGEVTTTAELDALARGVWQPFPADSIKVEPAWPRDPDSVANPPMGFDDFEVGSSLHVLIRGARRTIEGDFMVREFTVSIDVDGVERTTSITLDLPNAS